MAQLSACSWEVSLDTTGSVIASVYVHKPVDLILPFAPEVSPRWQIAHCSNDVSDREAPKLAVSAVIASGDGYLVGYNSGEFGGGLLHFRANGKFVESLTDENVVRIVGTATGVVAFTGLAHGLNDAGLALGLRFGKGRWTTTRVRLPGEPLVVLAEAGGSFLVVTTSHVARLTHDFRLVLVHRGAWGGNVHPNSIVRDASGTIYIGMSYAVARLRPAQNGFLEEWLAPAGPQWPAAAPAG